MAAAFLCATCGVQQAPSATAPERCPICDEPRQYVGSDGQQWTTLDDLRGEHRPDIRLEEPGLLGIGMQPSFAIGQRALLATGTGGNLLWDCIPLLDDEIADAVAQAGGIQAIAISHPHYYATMVEWAHRFDVPVLIHAADRHWVQRPDDHITFWEGDQLSLDQGFELLRVGGHFDGGTVAIWPQGAGGHGALLSGDIVQVVADRRWVSFMRSYPNLIPLPAGAVERIAGRLAPHGFERIYGAWYGRVVAHGGSDAVARSARRYLAALEGRFDD